VYTNARTKDGWRNPHLDLVVGRSVLIRGNDFGAGDTDDDGGEDMYTT
jgi:hypothetical protein